MDRQDHSTTIRPPYKAKATTMILVVLFFSACAVVLALSAMGDDPNSGRRMGNLKPETARLILWTMTAFSVGLVALGVFSTHRAIVAPGEIVLAPDAITAPIRQISSKTVTVQYGDVSQAVITNVGSQMFLTLHHPGGKLALNAGRLPKGTSLEDLAQMIAARMPPR